MAYSYSRIVLTCGVSAFGGRNAGRDWATRGGWLRFPSPGPAAEPPEGRSEEEALERFRAACAPPGALSSALADEPRVSAEFSALALLRRERRLAERPVIDLIHTSTFDGAAAAVFVGKALQEAFQARVDLAPVRMDVNDRDALRGHMSTFMLTVADRLRRGVPTHTCFAPLGGYKVMTSLGYLAGAYCGYPTLYAHEDNQVLHEIPAIPVRVSREDVEALAPLMRRTWQLIELARLSTEEIGQVQRNPWLFERDDEHAAVNAFGRFLMKEPAYQDLFAPRLLVAREVDRDLADDGRRGFVEQQLRALSEKLRAGGADADLVHERTWGLSHPTRHAYKGASNGVHAFRCLYEWADGTLRVLSAWTDHAAYERQIRARWDQPDPEYVEWK
ncbi:MAG: hypothetical protein IT208_08565 [Chthonomonadales bacterium]|nr:hypothetical protein [Chthonomonadales bacterium]